MADQTDSNINPEHTVLEANDLNQSRKACFLYFDNLLENMKTGSGTVANLFGTAMDTPEDIAAYAHNTNGPCRHLHGERECTFYFPEWEQDFEERRGTRPVSSSYESPEEASQRLG